MIIGRGLIKKLGVIVDFNLKNIWGNIIIRMWRDRANRPKPTLSRDETKKFTKNKSDPKVSR